MNVIVRSSVSKCWDHPVTSCVSIDLKKASDAIKHAIALLDCFSLQKCNTVYDIKIDEID